MSGKTRQLKHGISKTTANKRIKSYHTWRSENLREDATDKKASKQSRTRVDGYYWF